MFFLLFFLRCLIACWFIAWGAETDGVDEDINVNADHADLNPNFQIQRYSSSPDLVEAIGETIADFKKADLMPILVCDIDETLVYKVWQSTASYHIPTSFSKGLAR